MKPENKRATLPQLRFPEFRGALEWDEMPFGEICKFTRGPFGGALKKEIFVKNGYAVYEQSHAIHKNFGSFRYYITEEKFNELKRFSVLPDDIIMSCSGTMGKFAIVPRESKKGVINQALLKLTVKKEFDLRFIKATLELSSNQEKLLSQSAGGAIKNVVSVGQIKEIDLYIPKLREQQKIAECLSSLDDLLAAHSQKLDTLQDHKKGLMQQLFPAEGKTLPQLRFPEFQDTPEWEEDDLSKLSSCGLSNGVFNDPKKVGNGYKLINVLDMYIDTAINEDNLSLLELSRDEFSRNKVENGDLFFTRSSLVKSGIAYSNIYLGHSNDVTFDGHLIRFRPNKEIVLPIFVNYLLRTNKVRSQLVARGKTATMTTIGQADVESVKLSFPHIDEQQKIADCLSSLDEQITAQTKKIDALNAHKKGLMQQLFPSPDEVHG